jgi:hypothetical protein
VSTAWPDGERTAGRCGARLVRLSLNDFSRAFNMGNGDALDSLFAKEPAFRWYSSGRPGERLGDAASRRDTLVGYFADRHERGDRLAVRSFRFVGNATGVGHFHGTFWRSATDFRSGERFVVVVKGAAVCKRGSAAFAVFSVGPPG